MTDPKPHDGLEAKAGAVVQELHGLKGYEAWAQRIAAFARQIADEQVAELERQTGQSSCEMEKERDEALARATAAEREVLALREALDAIAGFGDVNLSGEWESSLRDIIRSMTDCAKRGQQSSAALASDVERRIRREAGVPYGIIDPDYARVFTLARTLAWAEGYAIAFHGSFTRDLDLIAIPWTEAATEPEHLVRRIEAATGLTNVSKEPGKKPHGRLAWTLTFPTFGDPRFVDLSIMPRRGAVPLPTARDRVEIDAGIVGVTLKDAAAIRALTDQPHSEKETGK